MKLLLAAVLFAATAVPGFARAAPLSLLAIALHAGDLPGDARLEPHLAAYYTPKELNSDTVPYGLTKRLLLRAGFQGLYVQDIARANDGDFYFWQYMRLGSPAGAQLVVNTWARIFHWPFSKPVGTANLGSGCRVYNVVSMAPTHYAMLCRSGSIVVLGHYYERGPTEALMKRVLARIR